VISPSSYTIIIRWLHSLLQLVEHQNWASIGANSIGAMATFAPVLLKVLGQEYRIAPVLFGLASFNTSMFFCNLKIIQCLQLFSRSCISPIAAFKSRKRRSGSPKT